MHGSEGLNGSLPIKAEAAPDDCLALLNEVNNER